jgi:hypothetical protein
MGPETASKFAHVQGQRPLVGVGRLATGSAKLLGAATVITLLVSPYTLVDAAGSAQRTAQLQHACAVVMGLHQPGDLYDICIRSLSKTLSELDQARLNSMDETACTQEGDRISTPAYADCVVNAEQSPAGQTAHRSGVQ